MAVLRPRQTQRSELEVSPPMLPTLTPGRNGSVVLDNRAWIAEGLGDRALVDSITATRGEWHTLPADRRSEPRR